MALRLLLRHPPHPKRERDFAVAMIVRSTVKVIPSCICPVAFNIHSLDRSNRASQYCVWPLMIAGLLLASLATAQDRPADDTKTWRGTWIATAGQSRTFRGRWRASVTGNTHNAANGSWTLLSDSNQIVLEGTWSARKSAQDWQGTWSARVGRGAPFSGTWASKTPDITAKTFEDLLQSTIDKQVAGSWKSGRMQGNWWLQGPY